MITTSANVSFSKAPYYYVRHINLYCLTFISQCSR